MKTKTNMAMAAGALSIFATLVWLSTSTSGGEKTYELRPQISVPEYRSDATRAIDAYERMMERYMDITEGSLGMVDADIQTVLERLDSIDGKIGELSQRVARIEKALGIKPPQSSTAVPAQAQIGEKGPTTKSPSHSSDAEAPRAQR